MQKFSAHMVSFVLWPASLLCSEPLFDIEARFSGAKSESGLGDNRKGDRSIWAQSLFERYKLLLQLVLSRAGATLYSTKRMKR